MDLGLDGKVALVTGSYRGTGAGIARMLAAEGATVLVHGLEPGQADETVSEIREAGGRCHAVDGRHPYRARYHLARHRRARSGRPRRHRRQQLRHRRRERLGVVGHRELARQLRHQRRDRGAGHAGVPARHAPRVVGSGRPGVDRRRDPTWRPDPRVLHRQGRVAVVGRGAGQAPGGHRHHRELREPGHHRHRRGGERATPNGRGATGCRPTGRASSA